MRNVLMVAFHYPPLLGSSGVHRTLNFSRHLPEAGWRPVVLTATPRAYPMIATEQYGLIPENVIVERASAFDALRHLWLGRHVKALALPDRWASWWPSAVARGMRLIRQHRPEILWSTYPIATAHLIALTLHRLTGIPWVADFRDPMTEVDPVTGEKFPSDPVVRLVNGWIERPTLRHCVAAVVTTPGTARMYTTMYPRLPESRLRIIANGYDELTFREAEARLGPRRANDARIVLLHSGVMYPSARDPRPFFGALADLRAAGVVGPANFKVILRASGHEQMYRRFLRELRIEDIVALEGIIPYAQALAEMLTVDGLLIFQASNCNWQIPAKLYEYLRARRPILALTDPSGDTAGVLKDEGIDTIVPLDSRDAVARGLARFLEQIRAGRAPIATDAAIERHSRQFRTRELATLLDSVAARQASPSLVPIERDDRA